MRRASEKKMVTLSTAACASSSSNNIPFGDLAMCKACPQIIPSIYLEVYIVVSFCRCRFPLKSQERSMAGSGFEHRKCKTDPGPHNTTEILQPVPVRSEYTRRRHVQSLTDDNFSIIYLD